MVVVKAEMGEKVDGRVSRCSGAAKRHIMLNFKAT
jgi:hypothetical protein